MTASGWQLPCSDFAGRDRHLTVRPDPVGVRLGWPPVGSAAFDATLARTLAVLLDLASQTAVGDPGGRAATTSTALGGGDSTVAAPRAAAATGTAAHRTAGTAASPGSRAVPAVPETSVGVINPDPVTPAGFHRSRP